MREEEKEQGNQVKFRRVPSEAAISLINNEDDILDSISESADQSMICSQESDICWLHYVCEWTSKSDCKPLLNSAVKF